MNRNDGSFLAEDAGARVTPISPEIWSNTRRIVRYALRRAAAHRPVRLRSVEAKLYTRSLMKADDLESLLERLERLRPDAKPTWGTLDAARMLCHVGDALRVALGEIPTVPRHGWLSRTLGRFFVVHTGLQPPPGKVKTAPEMLTSRPASWQTDLDACKQLAARVASGAASAVHPIFGPLTPEEWSQLSWKHMNHHLRQFGI